MSAVPEETEVTPTPEPPPGSSNRDGAGDLVRVLGADTASREDGKSKDGYCKDCSETGFGKAF